MVIEYGASLTSDGENATPSGGMLRLGCERSETGFQFNWGSPYVQPVSFFYENSTLSMRSLGDRFRSTSSIEPLGLLTAYAPKFSSPPVTRTNSWGPDGSHNR